MQGLASQLHTRLYCVRHGMVPLLANSSNPLAPFNISTREATVLFGSVRVLLVG